MPSLGTLIATDFAAKTHSYAPQNSEIRSIAGLCILWLNETEWYSTTTMEKDSLAINVASVSMKSYVHRSSELMRLQRDGLSLLAYMTSAACIWIEVLARKKRTRTEPAAQYSSQSIV